jgi:RNA polymerase sigma factor (TIGR02999 family)
MPIIHHFTARVSMFDVTRILSQIESGDPSAAEQLLPLVYEELRKLAAAKLSSEKPGQTLQATALVHDAYIRLVDVEKAQHWNSRGHFFGAAAEAMRRILVEQARRKCGPKQGGQWRRQELPLEGVSLIAPPDQILDIDQALQKLSLENQPVARLVELRYFGGLSLEEAAVALNISTRTAQRYWVYAKSWLMEELRDLDPR